MDPRQVAQSVASYVSVPRNVEDPRLHRHIDLWGGWAPGCMTAVAFVGGCGLFTVLGAAVFFLSLPWWSALLGAAALVGLPPIAWLLDLRERKKIREARTELVRNGRLAIAHVVQANNDLYSAGDAIRPALVVVTGPSDDELAIGQQAAQQIRALKGAPSPGGEAEPFWKAVNDESSAPCLALPPSLARGAWTYLVSIDVDQEQLPGNALRLGAANAFPALVSADGTDRIHL
jgi:hypothetical protein